MADEEEDNSGFLYPPPAIGHNQGPPLPEEDPVTSDKLLTLTKLLGSGTQLMSLPPEERKGQQVSRPKKLLRGIGSLAKSPWAKLASMAWNQIPAEKRQQAIDYLNSTTTPEMFSQGIGKGLDYFRSLLSSPDKETEKDLYHKVLEGKRYERWANRQLTKWDDPEPWWAPRSEGVPYKKLFNLMDDSLKSAKAYDETELELARNEYYRPSDRFNPPHTFEELLDDIELYGPDAHMAFTDSSVLFPDGTMRYFGDHLDHFNTIGEEIYDVQARTGEVRSSGIFQQHTGDIAGGFDIAEKQFLTKEQVNFIKKSLRKLDKTYLDFNSGERSYVIEGNKITTLKGPPIKNMGELYKHLDNKIGVTDKSKFIYKAEGGFIDGPLYDNARMIG